MSKLKKSELKQHLTGSVQLLKRSLDYTAYCYFILAVLFSYHVGAAPGRYYKPFRIGASQTTVPSFAFQRKRKDLHNELTDTFTNIETYIPLLKGLLLPAIPDEPLSDDD